MLDLCRHQFQVLVLLANKTLHTYGNNQSCHLDQSDQFCAERGVLLATRQEGILHGGTLTDQTRVIVRSCCLTRGPAALCDSFAFPAAAAFGLLPICWAWRLPQDAPLGEDGWIALRPLGLPWREGYAPAIALTCMSCLYSDDCRKGAVLP